MTMGYWITKGYVCGDSEFECSVCHETEWRTSISRFKFCPFCGNRMVTARNWPSQESEDNHEK